MLKVDFLPERIRTHRIRRAALRRQVALTAACVLGLVVLGFVRQGRIQAARGHLRKLEDQTANVERQLAFRSELEAQQADLLVKKRINDELGSRATTLEILSELEQVMPRSIFLTSLNLEAVEMPVEVKPAAGAKDSKKADRAKDKAKDNVVKRTRLVFTGIAPSDVDVANFISQLSAGRLFENVNMVFARNSVFRDQGVREFQAYCYLAR